MSSAATTAQSSLNHPPQQKNQTRPWSGEESGADGDQGPSDKEGAEEGACDRGRGGVGGGGKRLACRQHPTSSLAAEAIPELRSPPPRPSHPSQMNKRKTTHTGSKHPLAQASTSGPPLRLADRPSKPTVRQTREQTRRPPPPSHRLSPPSAQPSLEPCTSRVGMVYPTLILSGDLLRKRWDSDRCGDSSRRLHRSETLLALGPKSRPSVPRVVPTFWDLDHPHTRTLILARARRPEISPSSQTGRDDVISADLQSRE